MHPITYSLVINLAGLVACTLLAWLFNQPLLVVVAMLMATHALQRHESASSQDDDDDDDSQPMGFTADVK